MKVDKLFLFEDLTKNCTSGIKEALGELNSIRHISSLYETRNNTKYVRNNLVNKFISQNGIDFRGTAVNSIEDAAIVAKIFRDSRYETFRMFYVKDNKIVGSEGVTSKIPDACSVVPKYDAPRWAEKAFAIYRAKMDRLNADGYYLIHNHPSGNPTPSKNDFLTTKNFSEHVPNFLGHIIVGNNSYDIIDKDFRFYSFSYDEELPIENKGITIANNELAMECAKPYLHDDYSIILYCNAKGLLTDLQEIKNSELFDKNIGNYIANQKRENGSLICVLCTNDESVIENPNIEDAIYRKILNDAVFQSDNEVYGARYLYSLPVDDMYNVLGKKETPTYRVREE